MRTWIVDENSCAASHSASVRTGPQNAFGNHYWPALYFGDAEGLVRHHHFGEGEYQQSEVIIQQLLAEAGSTEAGHELVTVDARGPRRPLTGPA